MCWVTLERATQVGIQDQGTSGLGVTGTVVSGPGEAYTLMSNPTSATLCPLAGGGVTGQCSLSGHFMFKIQLKALGGRGRDE